MTLEYKPNPPTLLLRVSLVKIPLKLKFPNWKKQGVPKSGGEKTSPALVSSTVSILHCERCSFQPTVDEIDRTLEPRNLSVENATVPPVHPLRMILYGNIFRLLRYTFLCPPVQTQGA